MQVIVAEHCGFCRGVKNAVDTALSVSAENTYVLGELIHNQDVVKLISARGIRTAERVEEVPDGATLLIRSHGVGKDVYELCEKRHLRVIDCTCGFVKNIQQIVERKSAEGKTIVIAGQTEHPEVRGLVGWCDSESYVFSSEEEDFGFLKEKEVALVSQTTFSAERFSKIAENLKKVCRKTVEIFRTICYTTIGRQRDAAQLARICDAVLVIGGLNSSNTNKLYEIAAANCPRVYRLKNADDFEYEKILIFKRVGVIAGASTPDWQTQEVLFKMAVNDAEVQATTMKDVVEEMGKEERYKKGQIISAKIVSATEEGIYVSASGKLEIMVSKDEVDCEEYSKDAYLAKVGEEIEVMVTGLNPVKLSQKMVKKVKEEEAMLSDIEAGAEFTVTCTGFNKGGLTAELGTYPVFVPAKEIRSGYVKELDKYTGKKLRLKLIEIRKERRKEIIASQRVILEEEKQAKEAAKAEKEEAFFASVQVGDVVEGKVERVTSFGAFVSVNGFDCLAHISDLSWTGVKQVTDVLEIGKRYEFKVLKVDKESKKVSIGYKQLQAQPWDLAAEKYAQGDVVHGKVVRIVPFGAFVELEKGIDGLVHVSQISHEWLENPTSVLSIGQEVDAKILAFSPEEKKITLSIKALEQKPETVNVKTESDRPVKARKARRSSSAASDEDEYREWNEGGYGGASIAEMLHLDEEEK
ncbi:MAG: bifunctional 4-hydroxy-3-methylbut-2-enyl diphosphate reductase/30S ribosomal protein S1 [Clostridia bacterium]|mgnify:CR=1 FL=1|jgi:(E)-4-hydroxy-3-methyl-but-2-enyl pyrophosphate reductase|nr:bifunctional 4-hydroxy-3-methylbut-2-enyl diphosphate reductase/30S ribosomal protein S1 [Clostridia bacterium]